MHFTGLTYCRAAGRRRAYYQTPAEVDAVSGAAFAVRRTVFEGLGGFDEHFFMYVEDSDLSWRARRAGYRCLSVPGAVVEHAYAPAYSPSKAFYLDRNRHLMLLKNLSPRSYLRSLPGLLLAELVTWGFLLLKGPRYWSVKPRVYHWLWIHRRTLWSIRNPARSQRWDAEIVAGLDYRLEFEQLAHPYLARVATLIFHPAFWVARLFFAGPRFRQT
jgi:GT2 family glycosyltransferase